MPKKPAVAEKSNVFTELSTAVKCTPEVEEEKATYLTRLVAAVNELDDAVFDKLSQSSREWFNAAGAALNAKKLEDMPDPTGLPALPLKAEGAEAALPPTKKGKKETKMAEKPSKTVSKPVVKKTTPAPKATAGRRGRAPEHDDGDAIKILVKDNPKREGSAAHKRFELYRKHNTVATFLKAGGTRSDLRYDTEHKHISIASK